MGQIKTNSFVFHSTNYFYKKIFDSKFRTFFHCFKSFLFDSLSIIQTEAFVRKMKLKFLFLKKLETDINLGNKIETQVIIVRLVNDPLPILVLKQKRLEENTTRKRQG